MLVRGREDAAFGVDSDNLSISWGKDVLTKPSLVVATMYSSPSRLLSSSSAW